jgi:uncharacterized repeat protein (TIGR03803 family)
MYTIAVISVFALATLSPAQTFTTLHNFTGRSDGGFSTAGLVQDPSGNLYGITNAGGDLKNNCAPYGCGVVFKVRTTGRETVLHTFTNTPDGAGPSAPVARDKAGNLYGTTVGGGSGNGSYGTVFKIDTAGKETVLYSFTGGSDGCAPYQGLTMDKAGNLYGTALSCGSSYNGTIFKVHSAGNFTVLHRFTGSDGSTPGYGRLAMDEVGNIYGVTNSGGTYNRGVLYKLSKSGKLAVLYSFKGGTTDGWGATGTVALDKAGNVYGTTTLGGPTENGTIWKVSATGKETILHNFAGGASDGCAPSGVTRDSQGNLYGVTPNCGPSNLGVLYRLSESGTFTLLHTFDFSDGALPFGEVLRTSKGALYGTTGDGGTGRNGTVWSYVP